LAEEAAAEARERELTLERRRRRKKIILLITLLLLLAALIFALIYYLLTREAPIPRVVAPEEIVIPPPRFLFLFDGIPKAPMRKPTGVAVHPKTKRVYVADTYNSRISVFTTRGRYLFSFSDVGEEGKLKKPLYIAFDKHGDVYVTDRRLEGIYIFTPEGDFIRKFIPNNDPKFDWQPTALTFDRKGNLYVTDIQRMHRVLVFDPYGLLKLEFGTTGQALREGERPGEFAFPNGIVVDKTGKIFVADSNNRRIQVFSPKGKFLYFIPTGGLPRGIDIGYKNRIHVVDVMAHNVLVFTTKGRPLCAFGELGINPAQFYFPNGLDTMGRWIYVTDTLNNRVEVWAWPVEVAVPVKPPPFKFPWCFLLPLLLLPLWWLLKKRKFPTREDFLAKIVENRKLDLIQKRIRKVYVVESTYERFKDYRQELPTPVGGPAGRGEIKMEDVLRVGKYNVDVAKSFEERFKLDEESAALLAMARGGLFRSRILAEQELLREAAKELRVEHLNYEEFLEEYEKK